MRKILLFAIGLTLVACGRDGVSPPVTPDPTTVPGSYQLTTVDGQGLPFLAFEIAGYQARLVSGTLKLDANGTYSLDLDHRIDEGGNIRTGTQSDSGAWNITRDSIALTSATPNFAMTGTVVGNVVTLRSSTRLLQLRK